MAVRRSIRPQFCSSDSYGRAPWRCDRAAIPEAQASVSALERRQGETPWRSSDRRPWGGVGRGVRSSRFLGDGSARAERAPEPLVDMKVDDLV